MLKVCSFCGNTFTALRSSAKYCSFGCYKAAPKSLETRKKISTANKGKSKPLGFGDKISKSTTNKPKPWIAGDKNPNYRGKLINKPEIHEKFIEACKLRGQPWTDKNKQDHSEKMRTSKNWMLGKKHDLQTIDRIRNTKIQQYKNNEVKIRIVKASKAEYEILKQLRCKFDEVIHQFRAIGSTYIYDFYIPSINTVIQYNGDYWHANPTKYSSGTILKLQGSGPTLVDKIWKRDEDRKNTIENLGYKYLVLWESDYKKIGCSALLKRNNL